MAITFSPIQNHILSKLKNAKTLRYSELHPGDKTPNNLFNYHLQFLVKKGFVLKSEEGYSLGEPGVWHVADMIPSSTEQKIVALYKINVITIVSRIHEGELQILNQLRTSHPSFGKIGVMGGVVLKGELLEVTAKRKLREETGLIADFKLLGIERRIMYVKDELFSDVLFPIAYSTLCAGELQDTSHGQNMWMNIDESIKHQTSDNFDCIEAITRVLLTLKHNTLDSLPFFYTESIKKGDRRP